MNRRRHNARTILVRRRLWIALGIGVGLVFVLFVPDYSLWTRLQLEMQKAALEERVRYEERRRDSLRQLIWKLRYDTVFIEKLAREQYGMVRPGERVFIFQDSQ